jgi:hypothetical protein
VGIVRSYPLDHATDEHISNSVVTNMKHHGWLHVRKIWPAAQLMVYEDKSITFIHSIKPFDQKHINVEFSLVVYLIFTIMTTRNYKQWTELSYKYIKYAF